MSEVIDNPHQSIAAEASFRRVLRHAQRELENDIVSSKGTNDSDNIDLQKFTEFRDKNNGLFRKITKAREQLHDAELLKALSKHVMSSKASKIANMQNRYDFDLFVSALVEKFSFRKDICDDGPRRMNWIGLGYDIGSLFVKVPVCNTMVGPISKEEKIKQANSTRHKREEIKAVKPEDAIQESDSEEEDGELKESAVRRIDRMNQCVLEHGKDGGLGLLHVLVDQDSNVQTIENFFDMAFLIKDKKVKIQMDSDAVLEESARIPGKPNLPVAVPIYNDEIEEMDAANTVDKKQQVLSLNMKDVSVLGQLLSALEAHGNIISGLSSTGSSVHKGLSNSSSASVSSTNMVHREDDLYEIADAHSQADLLEARKKQNRKRRRTA